MENKEAKKRVWEGSIPLVVHLHDSEVTTLPPPPPALVMAPRLGYLPLLIPQIKPYFSSTLPPGVDTVWFDYKGLPLKWYIPTGVLFDLLCAEPERPWNLTIHFRGYPANVLTPCEGEDSVKWSFINSLKEAAYVINGNCKNVMNMSQSDQVELWRSVVNVNLGSYLLVSSKLKLGTNEGRIPVRLYVWSVSQDFDDLEDAPQVDSWDRISYINRPVEIQKEGGYFSLCDALKVLLPEFFSNKAANNDDGKDNSSEDASCDKIADYLRRDQDKYKNQRFPPNSQIKLVRIQGIEPKLEIPFDWVVNNLMHPEHYLHICVCVKVQSLEEM